MTPSAEIPVEPRRRSPLDDVRDPSARAILASGLVLTYGPKRMLEAGRCVLGVTWRDGVFRIYTGAGEHLGTYASWDGAAGVALRVIDAYSETA